MKKEYSYQVALEWLEDRKGVLDSAVLDTKIEVVTPPEFPKGVGKIWSPEHLFIAAVESCFMTSFLAIAENSKLNFKKMSSNAIGVLGKVEGKFMVSKIDLNVMLEIEDIAERDKAVRVLEKSEKICLITNSLKTEVHLSYEIK